MTLRFFSYARVSREEQLKGYSVEAQLVANTGHARRLGGNVVREFIEPGLTGTNDRRPEFQKMIRLALEEKPAGIIVHKYDRLNRSRYDAIVYKRMLRAKGIKVLSVIEPGTEDGPAGMLVEGMLEVVAEWYSINLSAEVKKGMQRKAANGERPGGLMPLGYERDNGWVNITQAGGLIAEAFEEFATGRYSLRSWAKEAFKRGYRSKTGKRIAPSSWQEMFRNKFYLGVIVYDGEEYQGKHTPLVDEETFMQVQTILDSRPSGGRQRKKRSYLFSGLLWSEDYGVRMVGTTAKQRYRYYRAKVEGRPELLIPEGVAEAGIVEHLYRVVVNGNDLSDFSADLRLALAVAPNVGVIYDALIEQDARRELLTGVIESVVVKERRVAGLNLRDGFEFDSGRSKSPDSNPHPIFPQIRAALIYKIPSEEYV